MPAVPSAIELVGTSLVHRSINITSLNATDQVLEVVCAWPVSGQYGPGTRVLYYVSMAACIFARKAEWIRSACLAAALLFPAVAALHAIVLATLHRKDAVDMDVYGAFQLCAIGILTAPATVRLSKTYFNNPGRDLIFLWTGLLLAGLLSLTVEFIRIDATVCPANDPASIEWAKSKGNFFFNSSCGMTCVEGGPTSPLRQGAADNIYVIPVPQQLTFNTATVLAAACCIPAILSLVSTWIKILEENWEKIARKNQPNEKRDEQPIEGTNGATPRQMTGIAEKVRGWLTLIEIPVFTAAVLAILIKGEMNFFSAPVRYQTEPIQSIGQWAPIVGTGLAVIGSLYLLLAADMEAEANEDQNTNPEDPAQSERRDTPQECAHCNHTISESRRTSQSEIHQSNTEVGRTVTEPSDTSTMRRNTTNSERSLKTGGRRQMARLFNEASRHIATKAHTHMKDSGYVKESMNFPEVPGETFRNPQLTDIQRVYSNTPMQRSRAASFAGSTDSDMSNGEGSSTIAPGPSRQLSLPVPSPARTAGRRPHSNTLPSRRSSLEYSVQHSVAVTPREPTTQDGIFSLERHFGPLSAVSSSNGLRIGPDTSSVSRSTAPQIIVSSSDREEARAG